MNRGHYLSHSRAVTFFNDKKSFFETYVFGNKKEQTAGQKAGIKNHKAIEYYLKGKQPLIIKNSDDRYKDARTTERKENEKIGFIYLSKGETQSFESFLFHMKLEPFKEIADMLLRRDLQSEKMVYNDTMKIKAQLDFFTKDKIIEIKGLDPKAFDFLKIRYGLQQIIQQEITQINNFSFLLISHSYPYEMKYPVSIKTDYLVKLSKMFFERIWPEYQETVEFIKAYNPRLLMDKPEDKDKKDKKDKEDKDVKFEYYLPDEERIDFYNKLYQKNILTPRVEITPKPWESREMDSYLE